MKMKVEFDEVEYNRTMSKLLLECNKEICEEICRHYYDADDRKKLFQEKCCTCGVNRMYRIMTAVCVSSNMRTVAETIFFNEKAREQYYRSLTNPVEFMCEAE